MPAGIPQKIHQIRDWIPPRIKLPTAFSVFNFPPLFEYSADADGAGACMCTENRAEFGNRYFAGIVS